MLTTSIVEVADYLGISAALSGVKCVQSVFSNVLEWPSSTALQ